MIRARSPFFLLTYGLLMFIGVGIAWVIFTLTSPSTAAEHWMKTASLGLFRASGWSLIFVSTSALLVIGCIERAIYSGWEPKWLRHRIPVCHVTDLYFHPNDPEGHRRIEVSSIRGSTAWYIMDAKEAFMCEIGDVIRLAAIGKYVSDIQILEPSQTRQPVRLRSGGFDPLYEPIDADGSWLTMVLIPTLAGMFVGKGLEHLLFGEVMYLPGKYKGVPATLMSGIEAYVLGSILMAIGTTIAVWCARMWIRGWTEAELTPNQITPED